jgi:hypothetical protein
MDRKWKRTIVIAALLCVGSGFLVSGPFVSRADAVFRYFPIMAGDPDDVYWASAPPPVIPDRAETTLPGPTEQHLIRKQENRELARFAWILSIILLRP